MIKYEITLGNAMDPNDKAAIFEVEAPNMTTAMRRAWDQLQSLRNKMRDGGFSVAHLHGLVVRDIK